MAIEITETFQVEAPVVSTNKHLLRKAPGGVA